MSGLVAVSLFTIKGKMHYCPDGLVAVSLFAIKG